VGKSLGQAGFVWRCKSGRKRAESELFIGAWPSAWPGMGREVGKAQYLVFLMGVKPEYIAF
tara:strand:+ start:242 stop:424 length:183 start_codon:yes stop_codon:yes gene_type:complete